MDAERLAQMDLDQLSPGDKQELQRFVEGERQKASLQAATHALTSTCWKKCIPGEIHSSTLDKNESACLQNCVGRFVDASNLVLNHLSNKRN